MENHFEEVNGSELKLLSISESFPLIVPKSVWSAKYKTASLIKPSGWHWSTVHTSLISSFVLDAPFVAAAGGDFAGTGTATAELVAQAREVFATEDDLATPAVFADTLPGFADVAAPDRFARFDVRQTMPSKFDRHRLLERESQGSVSNKESRTLQSICKSARLLAATPLPDDLPTAPLPTDLATAPPADFDPGFQADKIPNIA